MEKHARDNLIYIACSLLHLTAFWKIPAAGLNTFLWESRAWTLFTAPKEYFLFKVNEDQAGKSQASGKLWGGNVVVADPLSNHHSG